MIKGIIFDLDGTLIESTGDIADAINRTLGTSFNCEETKMFVGNGLKNAIKSALVASGKSIDNLDKLFEELLINYRKQPVKHTYSFPGVIEFLEYLNKNNIAIGVFSNKEQDLMETVIKLSLPSVKFDFIAGRNGKYPAKPDPSAVLSFAKKIKTSVDDVFYVGDSEVDYNCAQSAGVRRAILTWGTRTAEYLIEHGVDRAVLVSDMHEVAKLAGLDYC